MIFFSRHTPILFFPAIIFLSISIMFAGRPDKAGTAAASELLIPIGARAIATGGSSIALVSGIEAMYWNPAGLARTVGTSVMFSHMNYFADMKLEYAAFSAQLGDIGYVGFSIKSLNVGEIKITTEDQPDGTGEITSPTFLVFGGTFARSLTDRIAVGLAAHYVYEKMAQVSASAIAFNLGVQYHGIGGIDGLSVGATINNIGSTLTFDGAGLQREADVYDALVKQTIIKIQASEDPLPSTIQIGLGYQIPIESRDQVNISSVFQNNDYSDDAYKFGVEYIYNELILLRGGIVITPRSNGTDYIFGPSGGIGICTTFAKLNVQFDYAYQKTEWFSGTNVFTIALNF
jgi:hypothetical protein